MEEQNNINSLEDYIAKHQSAWSTLIEELNMKMKNFADLPDLQNLVYSKRQDALDYYFGLLSKLSSLTKAYKQRYAQQYNYYKTAAQIRYSSESSINAQIDSDLREDKYQIELLDNHAKYMNETVKTIDTLIYAINTRVKIEELIRGNK